MKNHNLRLGIIFIIMVAILILISFLLKDVIYISDDDFINLFNTISNNILSKVNKQNILLGILVSFGSLIISFFLLLIPFLVVGVIFILIHCQIYRLHSKANKMFFLFLNLSPLLFLLLLGKTGLLFIVDKFLLGCCLPLLICFAMLALSSVVLFIFKKPKVQ
ncbi:MAG: hypothetical protein E7176_03920 [Erysipelotrichaceae bacterium]|nr:hypothetical protein [Erysipelotrichaceae bacterium]